MKLFKAFCQGKSILVKDTQKLTKYIDLCIKTPVNYTGIQKSIGYNEIMSAQFNSKEFNSTLFPSFINLILRDLKELHQKEFNFFLQSLSCYLESTFHDKKIFENIINQISLNATYVQKSLFYLSIFQYAEFYKAIQQNQFVIEKFKVELSKQIPQTPEEHIWKLFIEMQEQQRRKNQYVVKGKFHQDAQKIVDKFIYHLEQIDINLPHFTNIMSRFILLTHYSILKYFDVQNDKRIYNLLFSVYTTSQNYIQENLSCFNSFGLYEYLCLIAKNEDMFQAAKWDILVNEINSRNFNEIPFFDIIALSSVIIENGKMTTQFSDHVIQHLYDNINSLNSNIYANVFRLLTKLKCDLNDKFITKLQQKVIPKDLSVEEISIILDALQYFDRIDINILEKYLVGIGTRVNQIGQKSGKRILSALNHIHQENPVIFEQIQNLLLKYDKDIMLQIEILKYLQFHDQENELCSKIQQHFVSILNNQYDFQLICSILEVLLNFNEKTYKTITIIPELKQYLKRGLEQMKQTNVLNHDVLEFLINQYEIEM